MPTTVAKPRYPVRTDTDISVQDELIIEQGKRQTNKERVSLMTIAAEWLEEKAREKRDEREKLG